MDILNEIKNSLNNNSNLTDEIRTKILDLVSIFHKKMPNINLERLNKKLKTVKIGKLNKLERKGIYSYNLNKNEILFSTNIQYNYDIDHLLMKAILEMTSSTNAYTGFNSDSRLNALNVAYTEMLANCIVGNDGDSDIEEELLVANLLSILVGKDIIYDSYFNNDGETIIKKLQEAEVGML